MLGENRAKNKDWKKSGGYASRLRESGSMGKTEVMLEGFWVRNGFTERLVTKLEERWYHGREGGGQACQEGAGM